MELCCQARIIGYLICDPNSSTTTHNRRSHYLAGLLLFGILGCGALAGCSTPAEPLAANDLALNNPPLPADNPNIPQPQPLTPTPVPDLASPAPLAPDTPIALATPPSPKPSYVRPTTAENGQPFPATSGYIKKYPQKANDGYSSLTIKNDENDSDVYVKIFDLNKSKAKPIRFFFVRARESFTAEKITPGKYDVRYKDLDSGSKAKTPEFQFTETTDSEGTKYSNMTMTLYKVANGNMRTESIDDDSFQ